MSRAATTTDAFNAIAERRRREIIEALAGERELTVGELVVKLGLAQPAVSKHLGVLRQVGLVAVEKKGQQRLYRLRPQELKPVFRWLKYFERFWTEHLDDIQAVAERKARELTQSKKKPHTPKEKNHGRH